MWKFYQPANVIFGEGELENLGKYMDERHLSRAFMVADAFLVNSGAAAKVEEYAAGKVVGISSEVEPNPTLKNVEDAAKKGYETSCNIMAISNSQEEDIKVALDMLGKTPVDVIYIVDSFGSLYPEQIARIADLYLNFAAKYNKKIGIHAHNNQQLAFANTIEACGDGVDWLDGTYLSMGRGAGNCAMELLLGFLKNPKYNVYPVFKFIEDHMMKLKDDGIVWGYDLQYLMTGLLNQHPRSAIAFTKENRRDYAEYYKELLI